MVSEMLQSVEWSRAQFALTAIYHWLFVPLTLGLSVLCALMETRYYRTGDPFWRSTTKFWMRLFGINFAIGVATGLILEFEFGTNWSNYSNFVGDIFGAPLAIEGLMAFFLEATFVAVMFFGWDRVSRGFHLTATWLTALGANLSAWWILVANAWMQYPAGCAFNPETLRNEMTSFADVAFSPVAVDKFCHTVVSSLLLASLFVVGVSAWYLLRGRERQTALRSIRLASLFGLASALLTLYTGDRSGAVVARTQPMKLAALEALYRGREGAPLTVFGLPRPAGRRDTADKPMRFGIEIPKLLSFMSFRDADAYVPGIDDLVDGNPEHGLMPAREKMERGRTAIAELARYRAAEEAGDRAVAAAAKRNFDPSTPEGRAFLDDYFAYFGYGYLGSPQELIPDVPLLFYAFRVMVGAGLLFILLLAAVWWYGRRGTLVRRRTLLRCAMLAVPLGYIASEAGWVVAEVGRQPWAIQDLMPVDVAASAIGSRAVATTFFILLALFTALLAAELSILFRQIRLGPGNIPDMADTGSGGTPRDDSGSPCNRLCSGSGNDTRPTPRNGTEEGAPNDPGDGLAR